MSRPDAELIAYGWAPGDYIGTCETCANRRYGDKRSWNCRPCAEKFAETHAAALVAPDDPLDGLVVSHTLSTEHCPPVQARRPLDDDGPLVGYLESDDDWIANNHDAVLWFLNTMTGEAP